MPFICLICRDILTTIESTINLSEGAEPPQQICTFLCGHIFHLSCLPSTFVLQNQQLVIKPGEQLKCPSCFKDVKSAIRLYPAEQENTMSDKSIATEKKMEDQIFVLKAQIRQLKMAGPRSTNVIQELESPSDSVHFDQSTRITPVASTPGGLKIGTHVVWLRGDDDDLVENGVVKWLGSISGQLYAGVEFVQPVGNYRQLTTFYPNINCRQGHGKLMRAQELMTRSDYFGE